MVTSNPDVDLRPVDDYRVSWLSAGISSDRHGIFRVNAKDAQSGDGKTAFGRVCDRLKIEPIQALTPQAKGRVERANQTLQDDVRAW